MKTLVTKQFRFESAHRLPHHDGKCKNLHGHSYLLEVTVSGDIQTAGAKEGMVIDFGDVSKIVEKLIISKWDHQYLNDILPFVTTAENLARECFIILTNAGLSIDRVKLWETSKAYVEVVRG
jgi:6-pyruvoyltetrahydropterin/6-carboxytetrahydropterin synthase